MYQYNQKTGELTRDGMRVATGYSGAGNGKNNPAMQEIKNVGPVPVGRYTIGAYGATKEDPAPHAHGDKGPFVLTLTPSAQNRMFTRAGFLIHGDSIASPGTASEGCIILPRSIRIIIWKSGDRDLDVVSGLDPLPSEVRSA